MRAMAATPAMIVLGALTMLAQGTAAAADGSVGSCRPADGVTVQVLGSGGPELASGRASSSYVIWIDGAARLLVDLGGGAMLRFVGSGARIEDLDLLALSHLHVDHAGDVPALLKAGYFSSRQRPLPVAGPPAGDRFPGLREWLGGLLDPQAGSFRYLSGALDGSEGQFALRPIELQGGMRQIATVLDTPRFTVEAIGVRHGPVPALAYRVRIGELLLVLGGDQDGGSPEFWKFARGADVLVAHLAIPEGAGAAARSLHAPPSVIGAGAAGARVRHLVLSHLMTRSESSLEYSLDLIREQFHGRLTVASDLACFRVGVSD